MLHQETLWSKVYVYYDVFKELVENDNFSLDIAWELFDETIDHLPADVIEELMKGLFVVDK
jgi:hypothetical protein